MNDVDTRVVQMQFDNAAFEKNVQQTIKSLQSLEDALQLDGASSGLDAVAKAAPKTAKAIDSISEACDNVERSFSAAEVIMATVLYRITNLAINTGKKIALALWTPIIEGGKNRALNIEAAKFQLEGMGVAWNSISDDINYAVQGTAYGLDAAAKIASQLVASGTKIGDEMKTALRSISGVAAMTNSTYEEIGNIFATIKANGKLMTMQLRQLSARGLNAAATLATALGKTEEEINDMVSKGKISFEEFASAMDDAFGEHAKKANDTFTGAMSNVRAALSRIGAEFESPKLEALKNIFNDLIPLINQVKVGLEPVLTVYKGITAWGSTVVGNLFESEEFAKAILNIVIDIYSWFRPIIGALMKVTGMKQDISGFAGSLNTFLEKFQLYGEKAQKVEHIFTAVFNAISIFVTGIKAAVNIITPVAKAIAGMLDIALDKTDGLADIINKSAPKLKYIITLLGELMRLGMETLIDKIKNFVSNISFKDIINALSVAAGIVASLIPFVLKLGKTIVNIFINVGQFLPKIINWVSNLIDLFTIGIGAIGGFFSGLFGGKTTTTLSVETDGMNDVKTWEDVSKTWDNITEKAPGVQKAVNDAAKSTKKAQRSLKGAGDSAREASKGFDDMGKSANSASDKVALAGSKVDDTVKVIDEKTSAFKVKGTHIRTNPIEVFLQGMLDSLNMSDTFIGKIILGIGGFLDKVVSAIASLFSEFIDKIMPLAISLKEWAKKNKWYLIVAAALAPILAIIGAVIKLIASIGTALSSIGGNTQANNLKALAIVIAAIGGVLLELALISKYVNIDDFQKVIAIIFAATKAILKMVLFISVVLAAKSFFEALPSFLQAIGKASPKVAKSSPSTSLAAMASFLLSVAAMIVVLNAAIYFLGKQDKDVLIKGGLAVLAIFTALALFLVIVSAAVKLGGISTGSKQSGTFLKWENEVHDTLGGVNRLLLALSVALWSTIGAIYVLGSIPSDVLEQGEKHLLKIAIGLAAFLFVVAGISALLLRNQNAAGAFNTAISSMKAILLSMSVLMLAIGAMFLILNQVKWEEFNGTSIALLSITVGSIIGMIIALTVLANVSKKSSNTFSVIMTAMGSIIAVLFSIALIFYVLNATDWKAFGGIGIASISIALGSVIALIIALGILAQTITTQKMADRFKQVVETTMLTIMGVLWSIAGMFVAISTIDWSSFNGFSIATIGVVLGAVVVFIIMLGWLAQTITTQKMADRFKIVVITTMASIAGVMIAIGGMFALMGTVDWSSMAGAGKYFIGAIALVIVIMAALATMATFIKDPWNLLIAAGSVTLACVGIMLSIGGMFETLGKIEWSKMEGAKAFLLGTAIMLALILAVTLVLAAIGPGALMAMGAILAIDLLFIAIGAMALMLASSVRQISEAINMLMSIDFGNIDVVTNGIVQIFAAFGAAGEMGLKVLVFLPLLALGLMMIVPAIAALAALDPSMFEQATNSLKSFFAMINETIVANPEITTALLLLALVFPVLAIAIAVGVAALVVAGIGLMLFAATLIGVGVIMQLGGDYIEKGIQKLIEVLGNAGMMIFSNLGDITMGAAALIIFGTELILAGTFLTIGGLLFTIGSGLLWAGAAMMAKALPLMIETMTNTPPEDIIAIGGMLSELGSQLMNGGIRLLIGSALFLVGSGLFLLATTAFLRGSTNFQKASVFISLAATTLMSTFQMVVSSTTQILQDVAGQGPLWYEAGYNIIDGLGEGIIDAAGDVVDDIIDVAHDIIDSFKDVLGIHSPSDVFYDLGWNTLAGFCEAIENGESVTGAAMSTLGSWISDKFGISMENAGEGGANGLLGAFSSILESKGIDISEIAAMLGFDIGDAFSSGILAGMDRGLMALQAQRDALAQQIATAYSSGDIKTARKLQEQINNLDAQIAAYKESTRYDKMEADDWMSGWGTGGGGGISIPATTSSDLASTVSGGSGSGSGINDASKSSVGGSANINSNNTYNFTQNNYSPESLSRTDIYTQTKQQLDTWYGLVRANPNPV